MIFKRMLFLSLAIPVLYILLLSGSPSSLFAQVPEPTMERGKILILQEDPFPQGMGSDESSEYEIKRYIATIQMLSGPQKGQVIEAEHTVDDIMVYNLHVEEGDQVLVYIDRDAQGQILSAYVAEVYRQNHLTLMLGLFFAALIALGRLQGLKTVLTLGITGLAVVFVLLPGLLAGYPPILLTVVVCAAVSAATLILVSGFNRKTLAALIGTTSGLFTAGLFAIVFGGLTKLTGLAEQEAQMLFFIPQETPFQFEGLLFAGIILGALGAIMDVGMSIASSMNEVECAKPDIEAGDLFKAGLNVGRDVMGTMSNTLILAYAGAALPLLLLFMAHQTPFQEFINWEKIAAEVVRALAGSFGVILTVPLTALSTVLLRKRAKKDPDASEECSKIRV